MDKSGRMRLRSPDERKDKLKTHLDTTFPAPTFDTNIVDWLASWTPDPYDFGGPPLRVGIIAEQDGKRLSTGLLMAMAAPKCDQYMSFSSR